MKSCKHDPGADAPLARGHLEEAGRTEQGMGLAAARLTVGEDRAVEAFQERSNLRLHEFSKHHVLTVLWVDDTREGPKLLRIRATHLYHALIPLLLIDESHIAVASLGRWLHPHGY